MWMWAFDIFYYIRISCTECIVQVDGLVQDGSISIAKALEILPSYTKPLKWFRSVNPSYDGATIDITVTWYVLRRQVQTLL